MVVAVDSFLSLPALPSQQNAARVIDLLRPCGAKVNGPPEATDTVSVRSLLESWADDSTEPTSALLYWVGHGDSNGEDLSLLTSDSKAPYRNSIKGRELAERVIDHWESTGANPDDWTFIVLDCCNGAVGAANILNTLTARPERRPGRVAVLAVSSEGASTAGRFADALTAAMDSFTENDESISLRDLFDSVAERTGADYSTIGSFHRITITNPRHSPAVLTVGMDQLGEWRRRLQDFDPDIRNHFLAKAQGTEVGELAWNFAGRSAETRRIVR